METRKKLLFAAVLAFGFWALCGPALADELLVPDMYPNIQDAINAAVDGDVVIVADGTYTGIGNKNLDFGGRAITVRSENGPQSTTIDCEDDGSAFTFHTHEAQDSIVAGFTITRGLSLNGGGISCDNSSPTIKDCVFFGNLAENNGGAMYSIAESSLVIENCTFIENRGGEHAGAAFFSSSSALVSGCVFIANVCYKSSGDGGAIFNAGYISPTIVNCLFVGNTATESGGAIRNSNSSPTIINCTFNGNSTQYGGAICNAPYASPIITNCIFWSNSASTGGEIDNNGYCHPTISYCNIEGGWNGPKVTNRLGSSTINGGGNIAADPLFIDAINPDLYARDYHLSDESPCIDAAIDAGVYTDIEGQIRPIDFPDVDNNGELPEFDIGAYETVPPTPYKIAVMRIKNAIIEKIETLKRIDAALEQEWMAYEALEELLKSGDYGDLNKGDIVTAKQVIHSAIQHQQQSIDALQKSIEKLKDSLSALGYEPPPPPSNKPPNVNITWPQNGAVFTPSQTIEIEANAWDLDGSVVMVEFFANGSKIGEDNDGSDGWTARWSDHAEGNYSLTATATDDEGAATTSEAVVITVAEEPPPPPWPPPIPPPGPPPPPPT